MVRVDSQFVEAMPATEWRAMEYNSTSAVAASEDSCMQPLGQRLLGLLARAKA
jgi:hypothetical protein